MRNVENFKSILWNKFSTRLEKRALINNELETNSYTISEKNPTIEDAGYYFSFTRGNRTITFGDGLTETFLQLCSRDLENIVPVILYKYGNAIIGNAAWTKFNSQLITPGPTNRGGGSSAG